MPEESFERLVEIRAVNPARSHGVYRVGSKAWLRDRVPAQVHLAVAARKVALCGYPRRYLDRGDSDGSESTNLPLCNGCRRSSDPEWDGSNNSLIVQGKMGWFRARPLRPSKP
jgi:hypothetical protein